MSGPEMERVSVELASRGEADVRTEEDVETKVRGDEVVATPSGEMRVNRWIGINCEPSGVCHFDREGIALQRVDRGASVRRALGIVEGGLAAGALGAGVTCATGMICDGESARTAGAIVLGGTAVLFLGGLILLASCDSCWAWVWTK